MSWNCNVHFYWCEIFNKYYTNLERSFGVNPNILYSSTVDGVFGLLEGAGENTGVEGSKRVPSPVK